MSHAATVENQMERHEEKVILIADVSRAFFEAPIHRKVAVELPKEALTEEEKAMDLVGMLDMSLYGTRDAALNFQKEVGKLMSSLGFRTSKFNPSLFHHPREGIKVLVHGDDFVATGERSKVYRFKDQLAKRFTIKSKIVGSNSLCVSGPSTASSSGRGLRHEGSIEAEKLESRILNRVVRWTPQGWEYEADQRHAELIVKAMGVEKGKAVATPGEEEPTWKLEDNDKSIRSQGGYALQDGGCQSKLPVRGQDRHTVRC